MKLQRFAIGLTIFNLLLLVFAASQVTSTAQQGVLPIMRARVIELVDENGKTRAQLAVEPSGEAVFRMRDAKGTIRTKMGAGESGSGFVMMDERTEATVQIRANEKGGTIDLFDRGGKKRAVR